MSSIALLLILPRGFSEVPIFGDRAYFTYLGQAVLRGEPYYQTTFMGYPPLGALASALSMWIGQFFNVPTYLAPRYMAVGVAVASVVLLSSVTRRATGSTLAGTLAGVALAAMTWFATYALCTLEPKALLGLLSLSAVLALQHHRWLVAGAAAGLAVTCFQPAIVVLVAVFFACAWGGRAALPRTLFQFMSGLALGVAPAVLYLLVTGTGWDFLQRAFMIPASSELPQVGNHPFRFVGRLYERFPEDRFILVASGLGFIWFAARSVLRGRGTLVADWLDSDLGAMPVLTVGWLLFCVVNYQMPADSQPFLAIICFWAVWFVMQMATALRDNPRLAGLRIYTTRNTVLLALSLGIFAQGALSATRYELPVTLSIERKVVARLAPTAHDGGSVWAFGVEAVYVLTEQPTPNHFLRLDRPFAPFFDIAEPDGCKGLLRRFEAEKPEVVVTNTFRGRSACLNHLEQVMANRGYTTSVRHWPDRRRWTIHRRPSPAEHS